MKRRAISALLAFVVVLSLAMPSVQAAITAPKTTTVEAQKIWNYFYAKIGNEYGVAGLMGNLKAESALKSINLQNSYEKKLGYTDITYTDAVDNGTYTDFVTDAAGYGLAQWTYHSRKKALLNFAKARNASIGNLEMQMDYLWKELSQTYTGTLSILKSAKSVKEASDAFLTRFEKPKVINDTVKATRASNGQAYYDKYATGKPAATTVLYTGKIHDTSGSLSVNNEPKNSKYCTQLGTIPEGATCVVHTNKVSGSWWWVEYNGIQGWAYSSYITLGGAVTSMQNLDINGNLNGADTGNIAGGGTVDIWINGFKVANDCTDYYIRWPVGTKYEIKDIRPSSGYTYDGGRSGSVSGTIGSGGTNVRLAFSIHANLDINGYLDGVYSGKLVGYGTADVYINGSLVANDCTDYCVKWPAGTTYEIKDIKAAPSYVYNGVQSGSLSGTIGTSGVSVQLSFSMKPVCQILEDSLQITLPKEWCSAKGAYYVIGGAYIGGQMVSSGMTTFDGTGAPTVTIPYEGDAVPVCRIFVLDQNFAPLCPYMTCNMAG